MLYSGFRGYRHNEAELMRMAAADRQRMEKEKAILEEQLAEVGQKRAVHMVTQCSAIHMVTEHSAVHMITEHSAVHMVTQSSAIHMVTQHSAIHMVTQ